MRATGLVLLLALALPGCTGMSFPRLGIGDPEERQVLELIAYAQRVSAMSAEQQRRAYGADSQAFGKDKSAYSQVRLALLLAVPGTSVRDDARAAGLLEPLLTQDERASPLRLLASLVHAQIAERQREQKRAAHLREQVEAQIAEREREQKRVAQLREQVEAQIAEREREHKRAEELRQQIEALKNIERGIIERGRQGRRQ